MAAFVQYIPRGVAGLKAGIGFMDDLRKKGEEIETATINRQIEEETAKRLAGLDTQPLTGLGYNLQGSLFVPNTQPQLGPAGEPLPVYKPPVTTTMEPTPTAENQPIPADAPAPAVRPLLHPGQSLAPSVAEQRQEVGNFNLAYDGIVRGWGEGSYNNPAVSGILAIPAASPLADNPQYKSSQEVFGWASKPETKEFFRLNPAAFQEFGANPGAAYTKYKDLRPVSETPVRPAPAPGTLPAAQPTAGQPAAPGTQPVATQPGTGERVGGSGREIPPGTILQPTPAPAAGVGQPPAVLNLSQRFVQNKAALIQQMPDLLQNPAIGAVVRDAKRVGVPVPAAIATVAVESEFGRRAGVSSAGASGDWQVTPDTRNQMLTFFGNAEELKRRGVADADNLVAITKEIAQLEAEGKTGDANRLTGLLRLRYNDVVGVPIELWGAAYQANAERVRDNGAPLNIHDGGTDPQTGARMPGVMNEAYNNVYVAAFNAASQLIARTNLVGGEKVSDTTVSGEPAGVVPPNLKGVVGKPPEVATLEITRLGDLRTQTINIAQQQRAQLDANFQRGMKNAEIQLRTLQARLDAARAVGNAKAIEAAQTAYLDYDNQIQAFVQKYQGAATTIQSQLNATVYKTDAEMTDLMVDSANYTFATLGQTPAYVSTYKAITGSDIQLQEMGEKDGQKLYAVFLPDSKTGEMKLFQQNVPATVLTNNLKALSSSQAAAKIAQAEADAREKQQKFVYDAGLEEIKSKAQLALEVVKGRNSLNVEKLKASIPSVQKFGDGAIWTEVGADNTTRTYVALPQVNPTTNAVEVSVQEVNPAQYNRPAGVVIPSAQ